MPIENRIRFFGKITDKFNTPLEGVKLIFSDREGNPIMVNDQPIGSYSEENGSWGLRIPSSLFHSEANNVSITARYNDGSIDTVSIYAGKPTEINFILGAKTQEEDEVFVTACSSFKCKIKQSFANNKKAYIYGIIGLVLLAVAMTLVFSSKQKS